MAETRPTNEHIAEILAQVLDELREVRKTQAQLLTDLQKLTKAAR